MNDYRFRTPPPKGRGEVAMSDARNAATAFPHLCARVTDVITSPLTWTRRTTMKTNGYGCGF